MHERLSQVVVHPIDRQAIVITSEAFCQHAAQACAPQLVAQPHVDTVTNALSDFIQSLFFSAQSIEAAAFLAASHPQCRTGLYVEIFAPLSRDRKKAADIVDVVVRADARLARSLSGLLSNGTSFVDTSYSTLDAIKKKIWQRWNANPTLDLVRFVLFQRG